MKYIGNLPEFTIVHAQADKFDYTQAGNPSLDTDPDMPFVTWLNIASGEQFNCTDNSPGANVWVGQLGTTIAPA